MDTGTLRNVDLQRRADAEAGIEGAEDYLTLPAMAALLDADELRLIVAGVDLDKANRDLAALEQESRRTFREGEEEQRLLWFANRVAGSGVAEATATVARAAEIADRNTKRMKQQLDAVEPTLSDAEAARAASLQLFAKEDAETLPLIELVGRMRSALARNDRAELFVWHRYGRQRANSPEIRHRTDEEPAGRGAKTEIRRMAGLMAERLRDGDTSELTDHLSEVVERAAKLRARVRKTKQGYEPPQRYAFSQPGDVAWE